eukprot:7162135-Prymnesium_polylepis.1
MPANPSLHGASAKPAQPEPAPLYASGQRRTSDERHCRERGTQNTAVGAWNGAGFARAAFRIFVVRGEAEAVFHARRALVKRGHTIGHRADVARTRVFLVRQIVPGPLGARICGSPTAEESRRTAEQRGGRNVGMWGRRAGAAATSSHGVCISCMDAYQITSTGTRIVSASTERADRTVVST